MKDYDGRDAVGSDRSIKTLLVAANLNLEGAAFSQYELTKVLCKQRVIEPAVYAAEDGPLRALYEELGLKVTLWPTRGCRPTDLAGYEDDVAWLRQEMRRIATELVYANTWPLFGVIEAAHRESLPSVWNLRDSIDWKREYATYGSSVAERAYRCYEYPHRVIFVSQATACLFEELNTQKNFMVIHNGLDRGRLYRNLQPWPREKARQALGLLPGQLAAVTVGTVCERKGQMDLLDAVEQLEDAVLDRTRFFLVGGTDNEYSRQIRRRQAENRRLDAVRLVTETRDPACYYAAADLFVFCSRNESFPRVILEAMACQLPVVTTPVHGVVEQVEEHGNALFYSPGDSGALARQITTVVTDDALRSRMVACSLPVLDRINDYREMASKYAAVFRAAGSGV
ncbi:MAG TPA: glycosyltransferase family 4 protein [Patescibacteria group bacterium]|nr:glycosyltransferase family 4 protein [Patescibacteria group bacterium]